MFYFPIYPHTISRNQNQNVRQKIKMSVKRLASGLLPCRIPALTWIPGMPTVPCTRSLCASAPTLDGESAQPKARRGDVPPASCFTKLTAKMSHELGGTVFVTQCSTFTGKHCREMMMQKQADTQVNT